MTGIFEQLAWLTKKVKQLCCIVENNTGVQSVTGLDTDNTDPLNPIVKISVDSTLAGEGTPTSPLGINVTIPTFEEGTFDPDPTNEVNCTVTLFNSAYYTRVGSSYYAWGEFDVTVTTPGVWSFEMYGPPYAGSYTYGNAGEASGAAVYDVSAKISAVAGNSYLLVEDVSGLGTSGLYAFTYTSYAAP